MNSNPAPREDALNDDDDSQDGNNTEHNRDMPQEKVVLELKLPLSQSLLSRLKAMSEDEGIAMTELAIEMIAEGLTKRVWDNQGQSRSQPSSNQGSQQQQRSHSPQNKFNNSNSSNNNNRSNPNNRNQSNVNRAQRNSNIMQDKAAFLEYVRNQEKRRR